MNVVMKKGLGKCTWSCTEYITLGWHLMPGSAMSGSRPMITLNISRIPAFLK